MANPMSALNEDEYINKLYDASLEGQKQTLQENYEADRAQLDTAQQDTRRQTEEYLARTYTEGQKVAGTVQRPANPQAALTLGNQQQKNTVTLQKQQEVADAEYQRQRQLRGQQYTAAIAEAQANNDMQRAQALYEAAKQEEAQLLALRQDAAALMAQKGDYSIVEEIAAGTAPARDTATPTGAAMTRNEDRINQIYDAQMRAQQEADRIAYQESLSRLEAEQAERQRSTDEALTETYVDSLRRGQNYNEVQSARGQGSGTAMQAQLAREAGLTEDLTELRKLQLGADDAARQEQTELLQALGQQIAAGQASADRGRNEALLGAAEDEEARLLEEQLFAAELLAQRGDYSLLGEIYGLTPEQMARLMGKKRVTAKPTQPDDSLRSKVEAQYYDDNPLAGGNMGYGGDTTYYGSDVAQGAGTQALLEELYAYKNALSKR